MQKIAVVIPTFSPGKYFEECLKSLASQSICKNQYCIYIALNGAQFPYESFIKEYLLKLDINSKFFYLEEPGVSGARNFLIDQSTEDFICFIDDDDVVSPEYLDGLLKVSSATTVGISDVKSFVNDTKHLTKNYIGESYKKLQPIEHSLFKARKHFSSPWAKLVHRSIISSVRFDTRLKKGEDSFFMTQIAERVKAVAKTGESSCYYVRIRPNSASRKKVDPVIEIKRIGYLIRRYTSLIFSTKLSKGFILSRVLATIIHLKSIFKSGY